MSFASPIEKIERARWGIPRKGQIYNVKKLVRIEDDMYLTRFPDGKFTIIGGSGRHQTVALSKCFHVGDVSGFNAVVKAMVKIGYITEEEANTHIECANAYLKFRDELSQTVDYLQAINTALLELPDNDDSKRILAGQRPLIRSTLDSVLNNKFMIHKDSTVDSVSKRFKDWRRKETHPVIVEELNDAIAEAMVKASARFALESKDESAEAEVDE